MRVAVVDLGTNTTRLLVAEVADGALTEVDKQTTITRLGQGVDATGELADEAMERVRDALAKYREVMDREGVTETIAVATSAMRDARNGPAFRDELHERFGIDARTISGDEEARLTFLGATSGRTPAADSPSETVVVDIGGGSTEFVLGNDDGVIAARSVDIGCVRMTERRFASDPPTATEVDAARADIEAAIDVAATDVALERARTVCAVAGTATTVAGMALGLPAYDAAAIHRARVKVGEVRRISDELLAMTHEQRAAIPVMHPGRVDVIAAGALVLRAVVERANVDEIVASEHDILDGIAWSLA
jgi:exopolyphosphatase / guanosine-5'-triphosphate,3'-diphosphate pyrophosphatase